MTKLVRMYVGGARKNIPRMFLYVGGARKKITKGFIYVGGARKQFFSSAALAFPSLVGFDNSINPATCQSFVGWYNDGTTHYETAPVNDNVGPNWLLSGSASSYDIRLVQTGGIGTPAAGSDALNTWLNLGTSRALRVDSGATGVERDISGTYEFALAGTGTPLPGSGTWYVSALKDA